MPHHLSVRLRTWPLIWEDLGKAPLERKGLRHKDGLVACAVEVFDIIGALIFLVGSICFLPALSHRLMVFLAACALFILGSVVYMGVSLFCLVESVTEKGWYTLEACENVLYVIANIIFLVGTVLYWPEEAHYYNIDWMKEFSLGVYFNLFTPEFEGTLLFILGSVLYAIAAFVNGVSQGRGLDDGHRDYSGLFSATTSLYMAGSLLFVVGSFAFLPDFGITEQIVTMGAWCYIIGSALFVVGGVISLGRVVRQLKSSPEREALMKGPCKDVDAIKPPEALRKEYNVSWAAERDLETQKDGVKDDVEKEAVKEKHMPCPTPPCTKSVEPASLPACPLSPSMSASDEVDFDDDDYDIIYYGLEPVMVPRRKGVEEAN